MKKAQNISFVAGLLVIVCYLAFAWLAYLRFPLSYSPTKNWLSDLGSRELNPNGAFFYNIGIIATACLLALFFLGLSRLKIKNKKVQVVMVFLTQGFGVAGCFCMVMSAIFPINLLKAHSFWSIALWVLLATTFVFLATALRYHQTVPRWLLVLGISTALVVNLTRFLPTTTILEWIALILFLSYVGLVAVESKGL